MNLRTYRAFQALVLAGLGIYLINRIYTGRLFWYINARFLPLTLLGALGVLLLAQALLAARPAHAPHDGHDHDHDHDHDHARRPAGAARMLALLALPVALGTLVPAAPLSAAAIDNRGLSSVAPLNAAAGAGPVQFTLAPEERTVLDWLRAFQQAADPAVHAGQPADVIGFVYHDPRLPEGRFLLARFTLTCCVADASAIALLVEYPGAAALPANTWVRARGPIVVETFDGRPFPMVRAESLDAVDPPDNPYLYP